jgi:hypothetical protein
MILIENHGPLITSSNLWTFPDTGKVHVSINAMTFRLLISASIEPLISEMATAKECLVSRGPMPQMGLMDAFEILFDDRTADPFAIHLEPNSFISFIPSDEWIALPLLLTCWTAPRRGKPHKALERPCWYRRVPELPWLKPREPE